MACNTIINLLILTVMKNRNLLNGVLPIFLLMCFALSSSCSKFTKDEIVPTMTTKSVFSNHTLVSGDIKALQITSSNVNTTFYVKLVEDRTIIREILTDNYDYYEYEATNKLLFYQDAQCTQPYTLEYDRLIQIGFHQYNSQNDYNYSIYNVMLTAGISEYQLEDTHFIDENWQGNSMQYKSTAYYLFQTQW